MFLVWVRSELCYPNLYYIDAIALIQMEEMFVSEIDDGNEDSEGTESRNAEQQEEVEESEPVRCITYSDSMPVV